MAGSRPSAPRPVTLPRPDVRFAPDFARRLGAFGAAVRGRAERREGAGRGGLFGAGEEFVGYRAYVPSDDLRRLDWALLARLERPYVRVYRRESSESWAILLDTSASMGLGDPGKLQTAAEVAAGIALVGAREGARVAAATSDGRRIVLPRRVRGRGALGPLLGFLEASRAGGDAGASSLLTRAHLRDATRVFVVGDLFDLEPDRLGAVVRPGREVVLARILAPEELVPAARVGGVVEWLDPETGERCTAPVDRATVARYEERLSDELEHLRSLAARHRMPHLCFSSARSFEEIAHAVVGS